MATQKDFAPPEGDIQAFHHEAKLDFGHGPLAHMRTNESANLPGKDFMDPDFHSIVH